MHNASFDTIYARVPEQQRNLLQAFRANHPYQEITLQGNSWRYITAGQKDKPTLVFLPGGFAAADIWFQAILALEQDYHIIAPDAHAIQNTFEIEDVCQMILNSLHAEGVAQATFIGLSFGGGIIQYLLQEHPEKVEHAVLSHCGALSPEKAAGRQRMITMLRLMPFALSRNLVLTASTGPYPEASVWCDFARAYFQEMSTHLHKAALVRYYKAQSEVERQFVFDPDKLEGWLGQMLLIASSDDALSVSNMAELRERYPRARTHVFEQGGFHTMLLFPEDYVAVLRDFLAEAYGGIDPDAGPFVDW